MGQSGISSPKVEDLLDCIAISSQPSRKNRNPGGQKDFFFRTTCFVFFKFASCLSPIQKMCSMLAGCQFPDHRREAKVPSVNSSRTIALLSSYQRLLNINVPWRL